MEKIVKTKYEKFQEFCATCAIKEPFVLDESTNLWNALMHKDSECAEVWLYSKEDERCIKYVFADATMAKYLGCKKHSPNSYKFFAWLKSYYPTTEETDYWDWIEQDNFDEWYFKRYVEYLIREVLPSIDYPYFEYVDDDVDEVPSLKEMLDAKVKEVSFDEESFLKCVYNAFVNERVGGKGVWFVETDSIIPNGFEIDDYRTMNSAYIIYINVSLRGRIRAILRKNGMQLYEGNVMKYASNESMSGTRIYFY